MGEHNNLDFSDEAARDIFRAETFGENAGNLNVDQMYLDHLTKGTAINGYSVGKRLLDITVAMWLRSCANPGWGLLMRDLYKDRFPKKWLDSVFRKFLKEKKKFYIENGIKTAEEFDGMVYSLINNQVA